MECALNGLKIHAKAVGRELNTIHDSLREIVHQVVSGAQVLRANPEPNDQFGVRIDSDPCPNIAESERAAFLSGNVLRLRVNELPNLIDLHAACSHVRDVVVLVLAAHLAEITEQRQHGWYRRASETSR